jgi:hypothetical protein
VEIYKYRFYFSIYFIIFILIINKKFKHECDFFKKISYQKKYHTNNLNIKKNKKKIHGKKNKIFLIIKSI